jgi:Uma2 family endonuclease
MAATAPRLTYDDLSVIPQERVGDRHELIDGDLVVTPSPVPRHQRIATRLVMLLGRYVEEMNTGEVIAAPIDVRLTPEIVLIPDVIFVAHDRRHIVGPKTVDAAPDLVVEILSPGTKHRDLGVKRDVYARFGVQEYWIVDPDEYTLTILSPQGDQFQSAPTGDDGRPISRLFPHLVLDLAKIFQ